MIDDIIRNNIPIFIFCAGLFFGGIAIIISICLRASLSNKIKRCTSIVNGIAYDVFWTGDGLGQKRVRFRYMVNGIEYAELYPAFLQHGIDLEKGQNVTLHYNPSKPSEFVFKELTGRSAKFQGIAGIIFGIFTIVICTFIALIIGMGS